MARLDRPQVGDMRFLAACIRSGADTIFIWIHTMRLAITVQVANGGKLSALLRKSLLEAHAWLAAVENNRRHKIFLVELCSMINP